MVSSFDASSATWEWPPLVVLSLLGGMLGYRHFEGLICVVTAAIMLAPLAHRIMHRLHWDEEGDVS